MTTEHWRPTIAAMYAGLGLTVMATTDTAVTTYLVFLGCVGILPCLAGLLAVVLLRRKS